MNNQEIIIIAAVAKNRVIGRDNQLLWSIPEDMKHFKELTQGHPVIMGRKTWESIPVKFRPLPNRKNIIISRQTDFISPGGYLAHSLDEALSKVIDSPTVFIIGGGEIYAQAMTIATRLEITEVKQEPDGDAWFPEIDLTYWKKEKEVYREGYSFVTYVR